MYHCIFLRYFASRGRILGLYRNVLRLSVCGGDWRWNNGRLLSVCGCDWRWNNGRLLRVAHMSVYRERVLNLAQKVIDHTRGFLGFEIRFFAPHWRQWYIVSGMVRRHDLRWISSLYAAQKV